MSILNGIVNEFDIALKTLSDKKTGTEREYPPRPIQKNVEELTKKEKDLSIQMMRINHAGEVAAQALYRGQAFVCKDPKIKEFVERMTNTKRIALSNYNKQYGIEPQNFT